MADYSFRYPEKKISDNNPETRQSDEKISMHSSDSDPSSPPRTTGPYSRRRRLPAKASDDKPVQKTTRRARPKRPVGRTDEPHVVRSHSAPPRPTAEFHPIIGITTSFRRFPLKDDHDWEYFYLYEPYVSAVHAAGGVPIIIPVGLEGRYVNRACDLIDGLVLSGGGDIDPNRYNDLLTTKLRKVEPKKDQTEIDIFNLAFNRNIPILGICRGVQVMNVALDGTLYQDIINQVRMALNHDPDMPYAEPVHEVDVERDSKLYKALGESRIWTNSRHHQGIKLHGKGLLVNATASDGMTEGLEHPNKKWVIGVQWHPEMMWQTDKVQAKLFKAFIDACKC